MVRIYAGSSVDNMVELPSPVSLTPTHEIIWSENTGRAQSGDNKGKMIGDVVTEKVTYAISWGVLTQSQYNTIKSKLSAGFFSFGVGQNLDSAKSLAIRAYRGEIAAETIGTFGQAYYKDVKVSVIEQ